MKINYYLQENRLPNGDNAYRARVKYSRVLTLDDIIDEMNLPFSGVTKALIQAIFGEFRKIVYRRLLDGCKIVTPFGEFGLTVKGQFEDNIDRFQSPKQKFAIKLKPDEQMQAALEKEARGHKIETRVHRPNLQSCTNLFDESATNTLTPGEMARVFGYHLKFDQADPRQGIFLLPVIESDGRLKLDGKPIRIDRIGYNKGRKLIFLVPNDLPAGTYFLEVRAVFGKNRLRKGQLPQVLRVL